jgi:hypothetical protein
VVSLLSRHGITRNCPTRVGYFLGSSPAALAPAFTPE